MSDYLTHLVARALGVEEVLRPRPLFLFEDRRELAWGPPAQAYDLAAEVAPPAGSREPVQSTGIRQSQSRPAAPYDIGTHSPDREIGHIAHIATPNRIEQQLVKRSVEERVNVSRTVEETGSRVVKPADAAHVGTPAPRQQTRVPRFQDKPQAKEAGPRRRDERQPPLKPPAPAGRQETTTPVVPKPAVSRIARVARPEAQPSHPARPPRYRPSVPSRLPVPQVPKAVAPPAAPQPIIQVTIGRVEVRAAVETKSRPAPQQSQPAVSLNEYLLRRERGAS